MDNLSPAELHKNVPKNWYFESVRVDALQRFWHKKRFQAVSNITDRVDGEILDIGSNDGTFSKIILDRSQAKKITGMDVMENTIKWANNHWKKNGKMKFIVADAAKIPFPSNTFDAVFALEVLEHVFAPVEVLKEIKRVLKKNGYGIFLVPSDNLLFRTIWFFWLRFYPRGKVWKDTHIQTYRKNFLTKISKEAGFKILVDKKFLLGMLHLVKVRR